MGRHAANLLRAGFPLVVNDVLEGPPATRSPAGRLGGHRLRARRRLATSVITMLPTPRHVEEVLHGEHGLLAGLRDAARGRHVHVVPEVQAGVADLARQRGISLVDAPVSGWRPAPTGPAADLVGGQEADLRRLRPIFEAMADAERILHVGGNGAG